MIVKAGTTDVSCVIRIIDSADGTPENAVEHNSTGIDLWYRRDVDPGGTPLAKVSLTEAALAALTTAHTDGGIELIGDGYYRLDLPDAAVAAGAIGVQVGGTVTGMIVIGTYIELVDYDPQDTVRLGLTSLPNAAADAAGGLPISDAGGLDLDGLNTNVSSILTDTAEIGVAGAGLTEAGGTGDQLTAVPWNAAWDAEVQSECTDALNAYDPPTNTEMTAAFTEIKGATWATTDTLEAIRDRGDAAWITATSVDADITGFGGQAFETGTAQSGTTTSITLAAGATSNDISGGRIYFTGGTGAGQGAMIDAYNTTSKVATLSKTLTTAPDATTTYIIDPIGYNVVSDTNPVSSNIKQIDDSTATLAKLVGSVTEIETVTATGGSTTTFVTSGLSGDDYTGRILIIATATNAIEGLPITITSYNSGTNTFTFDAIGAAVVSGDTAVLI